MRKGPFCLFVLVCVCARPCACARERSETICCSCGSDKSSVFVKAKPQNDVNKGINIVACSLVEVRMIRELEGTGGDRTKLPCGSEWTSGPAPEN